MDKTGKGRPTDNMNKYLYVVTALGGVGLIISLFLASDFLGPIKKIVGLTIHAIFG